MQTSQPTQMASDHDIMITHTHARTLTLTGKQTNAHAVMSFFRNAEATCLVFLIEGKSRGTRDETWAEHG